MSSTPTTCNAEGLFQFDPSCAMGCKNHNLYKCLLQGDLPVLYNTKYVPILNEMLEPTSLRLKDNTSTTLEKKRQNTMIFMM